MREDTGEKMVSTAGEVFFYKSDRFSIKHSRDIFVRSSNYHAYAVLVLPIDYTVRGVAYVITGVELNGSVMERPLQLGKFKAFLTGLKEDADAKSATAPVADIKREPVFSGKYYKIDEVDTPPKDRGKRQAAIYPAELKNKGITGGTVICFLVDTQGYAKQVQIGFATHKEFGESAAKVVEKWRFDPAIKNGIEVNCVMYAPIEFNLADDVVSQKKTPDTKVRE